MVPSQDPKLETTRFVCSSYMLITFTLVLTVALNVHPKNLGLMKRPCN